MSKPYESPEQAAEALYAAAEDAGVDVGTIDWRLAVAKLVTSDSRLGRSRVTYSFDSTSPEALKRALERFRK